MRPDKALRNAFRMLQMSTSDDPKAVMAILVAAVPNDIRCAWDDLEYDNAGRIAFAYKNPTYAHLLTAGITLPTFREELEWILAQFDESLPDGDVLDIGAGAGVTAAVVALATRRRVVACEPAVGAASAIAQVADTVGVEVHALESSVTGLSGEATDGATVAIAQSILAHFEFEADCDCKAAERSALISVFSDVGEALVVEHTTNIEGTPTWTSFATAMANSGMYPVWETASIASGYNVLVPDVPAHQRPMYARPKLCLRFSKSGDPVQVESRLEALLADHPMGAGWAT